MFLTFIGVCFYIGDMTPLERKKKKTHFKKDTICFLSCIQYNPGQYVFFCIKIGQGK